MLMSAVSAEENITLDDGANLDSDYIELDSNQDYNEDVGENPTLEDNVADDDENISNESSESDISSGSLNNHGASPDKGFNVVANAGTSFGKDITFHKSSSYSHYSKGGGADVKVNERNFDVMFSNFQSHDVPGFEALMDINDYADDFSAKADSIYKDYLKFDSLKNLIEENQIEDVFNGNINVIDFKNIDDLISFMESGVKYADLSIGNLFDINAFFDIFDKIMNSPSTDNTMTNIPSFNNNPTLRNHKDYPDYSFYQNADSIMDLHDVDDEMELLGLDSDISDILIIRDNMTLINQTFDLKTIHDVCINSYNIGSDLQLSDDGDCWRDAYDNSDKTVEIPSFEFSQQINCLSSNISEDIQHTFYHIIGCECTNTSFTRQYANYDNLPEVSEFDTVTSTEEDNHDYVLFKHNVNAPFIVENASVFSLFGVIKITIP